MKKSKLLLLVGLPFLTTGLVILALMALLMAAAYKEQALAAGDLAPTAYAKEAIPSEMLEFYISAAKKHCPGTWHYLAAIGTIESGNATSGGAKILDNGNVRPLIIGAQLNGSDGTAVIRDTDGGRLDGDTAYDRAVGPMQFIPSTWQAYATDGNGDGEASPHNFYDSVAAAAKLICANGAPKRIDDALFSYNHSSAYVNGVIELAKRYAKPAVTSGGKGTYSLPVARGSVSLVLIDRPHHDYPAWDLSVPSGTPIFAVAAGKVVAITSDGNCGNGVIIDDPDGFRYTYCHATRVSVGRGSRVGAGDKIMSSGSTGHSTGPHLHLQIESPQSTLVCPQPLLRSWYDGGSMHPSQAPTSGCSY